MATFLALAFRTTPGGIRLHAGAQVSESDTVPEPPPDEFRWSQGCAAFVQLALRSRLARLQQAPNPTALEGVKDSAAYALYRSFDDVARLAWPATIFGSNQSFQDSLERSSHQGPDGKLYSVRFSSEQLDSDRIRLYLDDTSISDSVDAVTQLLKTLFGQSSSGYRQLNLGILRSGELAYTRDIETGLRSRLAELGYDLSPTPLSYAGPQASMRTEDGRRGWEIAVQQRMERGGENGFDFSHRHRHAGDVSVEASFRHEIRHPA